ncbi:hypothetical protein [Actinomadura sp. 7K507]|uniref:hypothetical protein n=1 Tax=Actinomadura sp. 7K507 TaxID=2530365 RepID=UPI001050003C|nr:hypothetical protein [Actinomadura sp. 7K507]TDC90946.1 hypothetical protein E1285_14035 [Actinomadura sp. 7K507]
MSAAMRRPRRLLGIAATVAATGAMVAAPASAQTLTAAPEPPGAAPANPGPSKVSADAGAADIIVYNPKVTAPRGGQIPFSSTKKPRGVDHRSFLKCSSPGTVCLHTPHRLDDDHQYWATFTLFEYGTYYLSGFSYNGRSALQNHQYDRATAITERNDHSDIACFEAAGTRFYAVNYYPVWHVKLSPVQSC